MNDIMDRKRHCWNERLKKCILDGGYTQESFAHALNKKYSTKFTQKTISRWVNLGDAKNGIKSFPDFENMVQVRLLKKLNNYGYIKRNSFYVAFFSLFIKIFLRKFEIIVIKN